MHPTPYADVNAVLHQLLAGAQTILADSFVGLYLYGSLASGDFHPQTSDIDFVIVTAAELPPEKVAALAAMHARLTATNLYWAKKLEGSYIARAALRRYDPAAAPCPQTNEGQFYIAQQESDWIIQRHILREQGVVVAGPALAPMIDPVSPDDLLQAVLGFLCKWWAPMLENPIRLQDAEYQTYAILTMCRALHTLAHGSIASKPAAAHWAQQVLGQPWAGVIAQALAWRPGDPFDHFEVAVALIRHTVTQAKQWKPP